MIFSIMEDDNFFGTLSDSTNVVYQATAPTSGVTTLSLLSFPTEGRLYIYYVPPGGGTRLEQLFLSDLGDVYVIPPGTDVTIFYEPPADFVGPAGNVRLRFDNSITTFIDDDITFSIIVNGQIDDDPTAINLFSATGSGFDGFVIDDGLALPDGFLGGRYFSSSLVQTPELPERWGILLGADDLDLTQGLSDTLTFEVIGAAASDFEITPISNELSFLRMRDTAIFDADMTPFVPITIRVSDQGGRTYIQTFNFQVATFDEVIDTTSGQADRYAYNTATQSADSLVGNDLVNVISGLGGNDVIFSLGGDDVIMGGAGADIMDGGLGFDIADYSDMNMGVTISLYTGQGSGGDTLLNMEGLNGSPFDDLLIGNDGSDERLEGGAGDDALRGNGGNDILMGQGGNDLFFSGFGADSHDGGTGFDTVSYAQASAGVIVRLDLGYGLLGHAEGDSYASIEAVTGSNGFNDLIYGSAGANVIDGRGGNDVLLGLGGSDTIIGAEGDDKLYGGTGFDVLTGGQGLDTFVFEAGYRADRITDFTDGDDVLDLTSFGFSSFAQVSALASQQGADTVINFGNGDALRLVGFDLADLDANDVMI